jgi:hypothetical protein
MNAPRRSCPENQHETAILRTALPTCPPDGECLMWNKAEDGPSQLCPETHHEVCTALKLLPRKGQQRERSPTLKTPCPAGPKAQCVKCVPEVHQPRATEVMPSNPMRGRPNWPLAITSVCTDTRLAAMLRMAAALDDAVHTSVMAMLAQDQIRLRNRARWHLNLEL